MAGQEYWIPIKDELVTDNKLFYFKLGTQSTSYKTQVVYNVSAIWNIWDF